MEKMKKYSKMTIATAVLVVVCLLMLVLGVNAEAQTLAKGKYYVLPLVFENDNGDFGTETEFPDSSVWAALKMNEVDRTALIHVTDDGKYEVTMRFDGWSEDSGGEYCYQISKSGAIDAAQKTGEVVLGDYNLRSEDRDAIAARRSVSADSNANYYQGDELMVTKDADNQAIAYVTYTTEDISKVFYINCIRDYGYPTGFGVSSLRVKVDASSPREVSGNLQDYTQDYSLKAAAATENPYNNSFVVAEAEKLLGQGSIRESQEGLNLTIAAGQAFTQVQEKLTSGYQTQGDPSNIQLTFKSLNQAVFGKQLKLVTSDNQTYYVRLGVSSQKREAVVKESAGVTLRSDTDVMSKDAAFTAYTLEEGMDYYDEVGAQMGAAVSDWKAYRMTLSQNGENYQPIQRFNLEFDIPEGWKADETTVYAVLPAINDYYEATAANKEVGTYVIEDGKLILSTTLANEEPLVKGYKGPLVWVLANTAQPFDVNTLEDGVYSVGVELVNETDITSLSMANAAVQDHAGTLIVHNGGKDRDLYLKMGHVTLGEMQGYLYRMFVFPDQNSTKDNMTEVNYVKYKVDSDGKPIDDGLELGKTLLYPEELGMKIPATYNVTQNGKTLTNVFKIHCSVPIMDLVGGSEAGSGDQGRSAYVNLLNATKIEGAEVHDLTPSLADVNREALQNAIAAAEDCIANPKDSYDAAKLEALKAKVETAKAVADDVNADQTKIDEQTNILKDAAAGLEGYQAGVYTVDAQPVFAQASDTMKISGLVGETRAVVAQDLSAKVYMNIEPMTIAMPSLDVSMQGNAVALKVKSADGTYTDAQVEAKDADGNISKISFNTAGLEDTVEFQYYLPDDDWPYGLSVTFSNVVKQAADKGNLKAALDAAEEKLAAADNYTQETADALRAAVDEAKKVYDYEAAIQSEIDAQTEAVKAAAEALKSLFVATEPGVYTTEIQPVFAQASDTMKISGLVGETRAVVAQDLSSKVYMDIDSLKIDMPSMDVSMQGNAVALKVKSADGTYADAQVEARDADGNISRISFTLKGLTDTLELQYYLPDDDMPYGLSVGITKVEKQNIDRAALDKAIADGRAKLDQTSSYTEESLAALKTAIEAAEKVQGYEAALQQELDAQTEKVNTALQNLKGTAIISELGLYTLTTGTTFKESSAVLKLEGVVAETRALAADNQTTSVYLDIAPLTITITDTGDTMTGNIASFLYKAEDGTYKEAKVVSRDAEGNIARVSFDVNSLSETVETAFKLPDDDMQYSLTLSLSNPQKQSDDKTALAAQIEAASKILEASSDYDPDKIADLRTALTKALEVNTYPAAIQSEIDAQTASLEQAIAAAKDSLKANALKALIAEAKALDKNLYTPDSYKLLTDATSHAEAVLNQGDATGEDLEAEQTALKAAMNSLVLRADKTALNELIEAAEQIADNGQPGYNVLKDAITAAKTVAADDNATQTQVDDQLKALQAAIDNVNSGVDKSALKEAIAQAEALNLEGLDEDSVVQLQKVIASAKQVSANTEATQTLVDKHVQLLGAAQQALFQKIDENTLADGTYTIDGALKQASNPNSNSMGNPAMVKPFQLIKEGDSYTLRIEMQPLTANLGSVKFTGYLAHLWVFPGYTGDNVPPASTAESTRIEAEVESRYEGVYDAYNDPENGLDDSLRGQYYPHFVTLPVEFNQGIVWTQVYVPVMEEIQEGSGTQYARLILDWSTLTQISGGADVDKAALQEKTAQAETLRAELLKDSQGFDQAQLDMLAQVIATSKAVNDNAKVSQEIVDNQCAVVDAALEVFKKTTVETDKTALQEALQRADAYLKDGDAYTEESLAALQKAWDDGKRVFDDSEAAQDQVNQCVEAIDRAISGLAKAADKTALKAALDNAEAYLKNGDKYTEASVRALQAAYDEAKAVYEDPKATQAQADAQTKRLNDLAANMEEKQEPVVDKTALKAMLDSAKDLAAQDQLYTDDSLAQLNKAIEAAQSICDDETASQEAVDAQTAALADAMKQLTPKEDGGDNDGQNDGQNGSQNGGSNQGTGSGGTLGLGNNTLGNASLSSLTNGLKAQMAASPNTGLAISHEVSMAAAGLILLATAAGFALTGLRRRR